MENRKIVSRIDLDRFMQDLDKLYHLGFDYIDIEIRGDNSLHIILDKAYMDPEYVEDFEKMFEITDEDGKIESTKLTDEDLNNLS